LKTDHKIIGIGEVLFDSLPTKEKMLGGAPANFAYVAGQLGNCGMIASRVGKDEFGADISYQLKNEKGIDISILQIDPDKKSGLVKVILQNGQPVYEIIEDVAWDHLRLNKTWRKAAGTCDAVCFGSLAQRNFVSRRTIQDFVSLTRPECVRVFDVNLRQHYYSEDVLRESLKLANILKLNHEELPKLAEFFAIKGSDEKTQLQNILKKFDLRLVCLTRGKNGSLLVTENDSSERKSPAVKVKDTIGAGDAFTAAMVHGVLQNRDLDKVNEFANRIGAYVASKKGAMPGFEKYWVLSAEY
jgi:fructokinase